MKISQIIVLLAALLFASQSSAKMKRVSSAESPNKVLQTDLLIDHDGRLYYRVKRFGQTVVAPSQLGFRFDNARALDRGIRLLDSKSTTHDSTWQQPWGEYQQIRDHHTALIAEFAQAQPMLDSKAKRDLRFSVEFRIFDDGVGFRYQFPKQNQMLEAQIDQELTEFDIKPAAEAWWIPAGEWNRYEYLYQRTPLQGVAQAHTPITLRTSHGLHLAIHEAALVDYASMWLRRVGSQKLRAQLAPGGDGPAVTRSLPFATPWRTIQIAENAAQLYQSSVLTLNLNEPNKLGDVSWVQPSRYVGVWWGMHLGQQSWGTGRKHGASNKNVKAMIDFAAEYGFKGVLVEGWNVGWDGDWFANGWGFSFTQSTPDFDLPMLAAYAKSKGVQLVGHHETACAVSHYEAQMDAAFALYQANNVAQVKTGYVCDAGQIEIQTPLRGAGFQVQRVWHDGQWMSRHHLRVLEAAAKHKISINAHEPIKDTGLRRTYPNWLAREGARGMEYNAWGQPPNPPEHEANLFFTRMLSGPMDFTPGVLSLRGRGGAAIFSTMAKQLAQYVVLYSPVQMAADLPEHYLRNDSSKTALQFIRSVPVDWRDTRVLSGEVGDYVVVARQDRNSVAWYVGGVTDEHARSLEVDFSFLKASGTQRWQAQIYRDGEGATFNRDSLDKKDDRPWRLSYETREVSADDVIELWVAQGGGFAIALKPLAAGVK